LQKNRDGQRDPMTAPSFSTTRRPVTRRVPSSHL
jgi:hypothetical protein